MFYPLLKRKSQIVVWIEKAPEHLPKISEVRRTDDVKALLHDLKTGLTELYGNSLQGVYVHRSYARGDYGAESGFDVLVLLEGFSAYGAEVDRTAELAAMLSLKYTVSITQVFVRQHEWQTGDSPFLRSVRQEAVAA